VTGIANANIRSASMRAYTGPVSTPGMWVALTAGRERMWRNRSESGAEPK
jgi:hypothetical protein